MGDQVGVYTKREVKSLGPRGRAILKKEAQKHLRSRSMRKLINSDPVGQIIKPHRQVRKKLRAKLSATYKRLKGT
jgi:hypothetical protein